MFWFLQGYTRSLKLEFDIVDELRKRWLKECNEMKRRCDSLSNEMSVLKEEFVICDVCVCGSWR